MFLRKRETIILHLSTNSVHVFVLIICLHKYIINMIFNHNVNLTIDISNSPNFDGL